MWTFKSIFYYLHHSYSGFFCLFIKSLRDFHLGHFPQMLMTPGCVFTLWAKAVETPHPSLGIVECWVKKKNPFIVKFLELLNVTLFGKSVFADTAKLSILRRDPTRWSNDAKSNHKYPYKSNTEGDDRHGKRKGLCGRSRRDWSHYTVIIQGMPGFTKAGRRKREFTQAIGGNVDLPNLEPATQKLSGNKIPDGLHLGRSSFLW